MSTKEIISMVETLREWEALAAETAEQIEFIKDTLKQFMNDIGVEELEVGTHIIRWTTITSNRLDTGALKNEIPEVAAHFTKTVTSRRFTISD